MAVSTRWAILALLVLTGCTDRECWTVWRHGYDMSGCPGPSYWRPICASDRNGEEPAACSRPSTF